jgi:hypothetical protein
MTINIVQNKRDLKAKEYATPRQPEGLTTGVLVADINQIYQRVHIKPELRVKDVHEVMLIIMTMLPT